MKKRLMATILTMTMVVATAVTASAGAIGGPRFGRYMVGVGCYQSYVIGFREMGTPTWMYIYTTVTADWWQ